MSKTIRIVSEDGLPTRTHVYDEKGEEFFNIQSVKWSVDVNNFATAVVTFIGVSIDVVAELSHEIEEFDPTTGHLHDCGRGDCECAALLYCMAADRDAAS